MREFKDVILDLRKEQQLTQLQVATGVGLNYRTIAAYENGRREPDIATIKKLCKFFKCTSDYLLGINNFE